MNTMPAAMQAIFSNRLAFLANTERVKDSLLELATRYEAAARPDDVCPEIERELKAEIQLRIDASPAPIIIHDNGVPFLFNEHFVKLNGLNSREEMEAIENCRQLLSVRSGILYDKIQAERADGNVTSLHTQVELQTPLGTIVPCEAWSFYLPWRGRKLMCGFLRSMSGDPLLEQLRVFEVAFSRISDAVIISDARPSPQGLPRIVYCNEALLTATGFELSEVLGKPVGFPFGPKTDPKEMDRIRHCLAFCEPFNTEVMIVTRAGKERWREINMSPLFDEAGKHTNWIAIGRDVTTRRQVRMLSDATNVLLEMISSGQELGAVLMNITRTYEEIATGRKCSVILLDPDSMRMRHAAAPSLPLSYTSAIDGVIIGNGRGPCGTAMFTGEMQKIPDIASSEMSPTYKALAAAAGLVSCISNTIRSSSGEMLGAFATYYDVYANRDEFDDELVARFTNLARLAIERDRKDKSLRETEKTFRQLTESIAEVFWIWDCKQGKTVFISAAFDHIWGRSRHALLAGDLKYVDTVHPDHKHLVWEWTFGITDQLRYEDIPRSPVYRIVRPDGEVRWISEQNYPVRDEHGELATIVSVSADITVEVASTQQLREELERRRLANIVASDALWDFDIEDDKIWWSAGIGKVLGIDIADGYQPRNLWWSYVHPQDRAATQKEFEDVIASDRDDWSTVYRIVQPDGTIVWVSDRAHITRDENGRAIRATGSANDITQQRNVEDQLRQSQRLEVVGQLTGGIAHDFNNLLTVIIGNTEMLVASLDADATQHALAETVLTAALRSASLTDRLLTFSRKQTLAPQALEIGSLLTEMDILLRRAMGERIDLNIRIGKPNWNVLADPAQLESAILNLCINARDATPSFGEVTIATGGVTITADDAHRYPGAVPGDYLSISVADTGEGMDEHTMMHAFEPFFTTKDVGKGSGLGLSMVYGFVKQSLGHVKIESQPKKGTTVTLLLPKASAATAGSNVADAAAQVEFGAETILLVEDNTLVREHVEAQLQGLGYRVLTADNGEVALRIVQKVKTIDLLFTDVVMPGSYNGAELAEEVADIRPDLPILFTSGYAEEKLSEEKRHSLGIELLRKPYRRHELAAKIRQVLAASR